MPVGGLSAGRAYIQVVPSLRGWDSGVKSQLKSSSASATSAGKQTGSRFTEGFKRSLKIGAVAGAALAGAAGAQFLRSSIKQASDLSESINAVNVTFGKSAEGIRRLGEAAADSVGLSQTQFNGLAVQFSSFASTIAGDGGNVVKTMRDLTTRGADFASVMNLEVNEAMRLFQSGLAGESEPLRKFGIDLSAAAVESFAYAEGIAAVGKKLTENQKVQARYGLLMEKTAKTQGDFKNTSDSLANSQRRLSANWENLQAEVGAKVIPALEKLSKWAIDDGLPALRKVGGAVSSITAFLKDHKVEVAAATVALTALVAITKIHAAVLAVQAAGGLAAMIKATKTYTAVQWLLNAALTANPIGLVIAAIAALAAGLVIAYKKSETFRKIVNGAWEAVKDGAMGMVKFVVDGVLWMVEKVVGLMAKIPGPTQKAFKKAADEVKGFRKEVNRELDAISDEEVKIGFAVGRRKSQESTNSGFGPQLGGGGGRPGTGAFGGARVLPRVNADIAGARSIAASAGEQAKAIASEVAKSMVGQMGQAGRVLPRGSYRIGMPYLGYSGHYGADYPAATGTPVYSLAGGVVTRAMTMSGSYGKHVYVAHPGGVETRYAHLNSYRVSAGQRVMAGQPLGTVGSTGNSSGPHLHFEYRRNGSPVNPASLGVFDNGGWMKPGMGGINLTKKPEPVLTNGQWQKVGGMLNAFGGKGGLAKALGKLTKQLDKLGGKLDRVRQNRRDLVSATSGAFDNDIFGNGLAGAMLQLRADANDANGFAAGIKRTRRLGLSGAAASALFASGDRTTLDQLTTRGQVAAFERAFGARSAAQRLAGQAAGSSVYGAREAQLEKAVDRLTKQVKRIRGEVRAGSREGTQKGMTDRGRKTGQRAKAGR